jgi:hypothetical protein
MGILQTPVKINGTVCRNCYDVDWARKAEAEDTKKRKVESAKKARRSIEPTGTSPDKASGVNAASGFDNQPVTTFGGSLASSISSNGPVAPPPTDTPGQSVSIFA